MVITGRGEEMIKYFCDSCGKELKPGMRFNGSWRIRMTWINLKIEIKNNKDYCWDCIKTDVINGLDFSMKQQV